LDPAQFRAQLGFEEMNILKKLNGFFQTVRANIAKVALAVVAVAVLVAEPALAGTDTTFASATTSITNYTTGSLGKLAAVATVAFGLVGVIARFDWKLIAAGVGVGLAASTGPGIVSAMVTVLI
jgi:conjugal transfer pilus assembly protein TraA